MYEQFPTTTLRRMKHQAETELRVVRSLMEWERQALAEMVVDLAAAIAEREGDATRLAADSEAA
jgi:hypothetical protein